MMTGRSHGGIKAAVAAAAGVACTVASGLQAPDLAAAVQAGALVPVSMIVPGALIAAACGLFAIAARSLRPAQTPAAPEPAELLDQMLLLERQTTERLARQLHDTAMQSLVVAAYLARTHDGLDAEGLTDQVLTAEREVREAIADVRQIASVTDGFGAACQRLHETVDMREGIDITWSWNGRAEAALPYATAIVAFRVLQEALTNVARHAGTDAAQVSVDVTSSSIRVAIADSGCGFTPGPVEPVGGDNTSGLSLLQSWAAVVGGHVRVDSAPLAGCTLTFTAPIAQPPGTSVTLGKAPVAQSRPWAISPQPRVATV